MRLFAIADLHLPGGANKPMDVFGKHWEGHFEKICDSWRENVSGEDIVLLPGDLSWAMQLEEAMGDLARIGTLPGRKVLLRGNHDYWWGSIGKLRERLPGGMYAIQNDAVALDGLTVAGSRGWTHPDGSDQEDKKIYDRELIRLKMSLDRAAALGGRLVVMTHYPPLDENHRDTPVSDLIRQYRPTDVIYGHLHGASLKSAFNGRRDGIRYHCVSCDGLGFRIREIPAPDTDGL